jgi:NADH-quinone oxidoreductase subunit H
VTVLTRPWRRLSATGKIVLPLLAVLTLATVGLLALWTSGLGPAVVQAVLDTLAANAGIVRFVVAVTAVLLFTVPTAFVVIFMEMKLIAFVNLRIGPNRTGPWGTLSSLFHGFKVLAKEDFTPTGADVPVFTLAPAVAYLASVMTLLVIPFAPGLVGFEMELGLLYFFAVGGLSVVGLMMGGWASFNKYSLLGGLRAAAAVVSYELPLVLGALGVVMLAGTMNLVTIVEDQAGSFLDWYIFQQPLAAIVFFIAATAEGGRTPFDLTEADSEIVAGFATEYSGMRFGFFFFAEYVNVFILSALTATLFLGGWNAPFDLDPLLELVGIATPLSIPLDPGSLGPGLLGLLVIGAPLAVLALGLAVWMLVSSWGIVRSLVVGFILFNLLIGGALMLWAAVSFEAVMALAWFLLKAFGLAAFFVLMRGTLPRVRVDELMGFAWKWLMPAALANLFVTGAALIVVAELGGAA